MAKATVTFLIKHVALAIYESGDVKRTSKTQKITGAMDIARHRLVEYEFLRKGSEKGEISNVKLTPKGQVAERKHKHHGPAKKNQKFYRLYALIAGADEIENESPFENENEENSVDARPQRKQRIQTRHAHVAKSAAGPKKKIRVPKRVKRAKQASAKSIRRR